MREYNAFNLPTGKLTQSKHNLQNHFQLFHKHMIIKFKKLKAGCSCYRVKQIFRINKRDIRIKVLHVSA